MQVKKKTLVIGLSAFVLILIIIGANNAMSSPEDLKFASAEIEILADIDTPCATAGASQCRTVGVQVSERRCHVDGNGVGEWGDWMNCCANCFCSGGPTGNCQHK